jgi:hypothetical protein
MNKRGFLIGELRHLHAKSPPPVKKPRQSRGKGEGRHVVWRNAHLYRCVREGVGQSFASEKEIDVCYQNKQISEENFWIFRNDELNAQRSEEKPLFEVVYRCRDSWILAQKCHMMQAYVKAGRTKADQMWNLMPDGTPYWADRYAFRKTKQKLAKVRYEESLKVGE